MGGEKMDMEKMISSAKTRADHEALAADFEKEAAEAKSKADETPEDGGELTSSSAARRSASFHLDEHCERLAKIVRTGSDGIRHAGEGASPDGEGGEVAPRIAWVTFS